MNDEGPSPIAQVAHILACLDAGDLIWERKGSNNWGGGRSAPAADAKRPPPEPVARRPFGEYACANPDCGAMFTVTVRSPRKRFCSERCSNHHHAARWRDYDRVAHQASNAARTDARHVHHLGDVIACAECGLPLTIDIPHRRLHPECAAARRDRREQTGSTRRYRPRGSQPVATRRTGTWITCGECQKPLLRDCGHREYHPACAHARKLRRKREERARLRGSCE